MTVEAILQILALSNQLRSPVDAFISFRAGPPPNESTVNFLKRFEEAYHRMPTRERTEREVECTIEYTLQTHAGMVWNSLVQQDEAYPLHSALSNGWLVAEKHQNWMARFAARPVDREFLPTYQDPLWSQFNSSNTFTSQNKINLEDPVASVNVATANTVCYNCGKMGHFSTDCRSHRRPDARYLGGNNSSFGQDISGTFKAKIMPQGKIQPQKQSQLSIKLSKTNKKKFKRIIEDRLLHPHGDQTILRPCTLDKLFILTRTTNSGTRMTANNMKE
ncbi:hypothetical protein K3495_g7712 [Podosphaera aphanis]|nr:hypothetical protein K3495_g7712 [Podosphaera aphanis]